MINANRAAPERILPFDQDATVKVLLDTLTHSLEYNARSPLQTD